MDCEGKISDDTQTQTRVTRRPLPNPTTTTSVVNTWLLQMHQENGLQFRSYVPTLMELLEDADGMVRDAAKTTVIELFRYVATRVLSRSRSGS